MDKEEFIYLTYKDNVIKVKAFKEILKNTYHIIGDNATRIINRIFDYQKARYGDLLNNDNIWYTREELERIGIFARTRRHNKRVYQERR